MQNDADAHVTPSSPPGSIVVLVDHAVPLYVDALPSSVTAAQNDADGQATPLGSLEPEPRACVGDQAEPLKASTLVPSAARQNVGDAHDTVAWGPPGPESTACTFDHADPFQVEAPALVSTARQKEGEAHDTAPKGFVSTPM